jgi:hypothetical protein
MKKPRKNSAERRSSRSPPLVGKVVVVRGFNSFPRIYILQHGTSMKLGEHPWLCSYESLNCARNNRPSISGALL